MTPAAGGCARLSGVASGPAQAAGRRRRRLSEDERREQIIRGCVEVLADEGYPNASLARIAQAAGVSKGLVSHYFSDKETLMEQTAIATVAYLRDEVGPRSTSPWRSRTSSGRRCTTPQSAPNPFPRAARGRPDRPQPT